MSVIEIRVFVILIYLLFAFLLPLLILPNHLIKTKIKETEKIRNLAKNLRGKTKEKTLKNIYNYTINNCSSERYKLLYIPKLFSYNVKNPVLKH